MKKISKKGITIVTLVITVIILIILTAAVMLTMTDSGMFGQAQDTVNEHNKKAGIEKITIDVESKMIEKINTTGRYTPLTIAEVIEIMEKHGTYDEGTMMLTMEEGTKISLLEIINEGVNEYVEVKAEEGKLVISTTLPSSIYVIEYTTNGTTWYEYTGEVAIENEEDVQVRVTDKTGNVISGSSSVIVNKDQVKLVSISAVMRKTSFELGQTISKSDITVTATYSDGTTKTITNYEYSPTGALTTNDTTVSITYTENGKTVTTSKNITVKKELERITISTAATDVEYRQGETFNTSGMVVKAIYKDGTEKEVTNYTVTPNGALSSTNTSVTITYIEGGISKTATQSIKVAALESISVENTPYTTEYNHGETFDKEGMSITAIYKYPDNTTFGLPVTGWRVTNGAVEYGQESVTITYTEGGITKQTTQAITVNRVLNSIAVTKEPTKKSYETGDTFDKSGMEVTAYYSDGGSVVLASSSYSVSAPTYGSTSVTVTYTENNITKTDVVTGLTVKGKFTVTYNYSTNGGTSATKTTATVVQGEAIDLTPTASKSGWEFVGWNTSSTANTGLSSLSMSTDNVKLYAIYKKDVTVTLYHGLNTSTEYTGTMWNTATSASVTVSPSAISTINGKSVTGTLKGITTSSTATTGYSTNYKVSVSSDTTYYAVYTLASTVTYDLSEYSAGTFNENVSATYNASAPWSGWSVSCYSGNSAYWKAGTGGRVMNAGVTGWRDSSNSTTHSNIGGTFKVETPSTVLTATFASRTFTFTFPSKAHIFTSYGAYSDGGGNPTKVCSCGGMVLSQGYTAVSATSKTYCAEGTNYYNAGATLYKEMFTCDSCGRSVWMGGRCGTTVTF